MATAIELESVRGVAEFSVDATADMVEAFNKNDATAFAQALANGADPKAITPEKMEQLAGYIADIDQSSELEHLDQQQRKETVAKLKAAYEGISSARKDKLNAMLHHFEGAGDLANLQATVEAGADITSLNDAGDNVYQSAVRHRKTDIAKYLSDVATDLLPEAAAQSDRTEVEGVNSVLAAGARVFTEEGRSALNSVTSKEDAQAILAAAFATEANKALFDAVAKGDQKAILTAIRMGADLTAKNELGQTAFEQSKDSWTRQLLSQEATNSMASYAFGFTGETPDRLNVLIRESGAQVLDSENRITDGAQKALSAIAADGESHKVMKAAIATEVNGRLAKASTVEHVNDLLAVGADPLALDTLGNTARENAQARGNTAVADRLAQAATVNLPRDFNDPDRLRIAFEKGGADPLSDGANEAKAKAEGANPHSVTMITGVQTKAHTEALVAAAMANDKDAIAAALEKGANLHVAGEALKQQGNAPGLAALQPYADQYLKVAIANDNPAMVQATEEAGFNVSAARQNPQGKLAAYFNNRDLGEATAMALSNNPHNRETSHTDLNNHIKAVTWETARGNPDKLTHKEGNVTVIDVPETARFVDINYTTNQITFRQFDSSETRGTNPTSITIDMPKDGSQIRLNGESAATSSVVQTNFKGVPNSRSPNIELDPQGANLVLNPTALQSLRVLTMKDKEGTPFVGSNDPEMQERLAVGANGAGVMKYAQDRNQAALTSRMAQGALNQGVKMTDKERYASLDAASARGMQSYAANHSITQMDPASFAMSRDGSPTAEQTAKASIPTFQQANKQYDDLLAGKGLGGIGVTGGATVAVSTAGDGRHAANSTTATIPTDPKLTGKAAATPSSPG